MPINRNPFDEIGLIKITLPGGMFSGFKLSQVRSFADHWNIKVKKVDGEWELSTDDPKNLFWFGCNVNNHHLEDPNGFSKWVQIGDNYNKIPHKDLLKLAGVKDLTNNHRVVNLPNGKIVVRAIHGVEME